MKFINSERVYYLTEYANINHPFLKALAFGILAPVKKAIRHLLRGEVRDFTSYIGITTSLLLHTRQVIRTRKRTKET